MRLLTNQAFAAYAARIGQKSATWAADTLQTVEAIQGQIDPTVAGRYLAEIRGILDYIEAQLDASGSDDRDCPKCRGGGCDWCENTGYVSECSTYSGVADDWKCPVCGASIEDECRATIERSCFWNARGVKQVPPVSGCDDV